jgi:protein-S-isoprenylcysteine O-methyltransferase Ste14
MHAANIIVTISWAVVFAVYLVLMFTNKRTRERDAAGTRVWYHVPTILSYLFMFSPMLWIGELGKSWITRGVVEEGFGTALAVAGGALAIWARLSIGRNWSAVVTVKEDHHLVRVGPYAWIRHPIYTGLITAMAGTALVNRRWAGVVALALMTAAFLFKSRIEERFMVRTFGREYEEYRAQSGAFLPRI